ncbi:MAG TPA: hypothetical protein VGE10_06720 [Zeimonas sp.]
MRKQPDSTPDSDLQSLRETLDRAEFALMECQQIFGAVFDAADNDARVSVLAKVGIKIAGAAHDEIDAMERTVFGAVQGAEA